MLILYKNHQLALGIFQFANFTVSVVTEAKLGLKRMLRCQYFWV